MNVLITGASRGIGAAAARAFAQNGDSVVINYNKSENEALALADDIGAQAIKADVSDSAAVKAMFVRARELFGHIDVLVNNAGIEWQGLLTDMREEEWDKLMSVNLKGAYICCREAVPDMVSRRFGRIINITSMWGDAGASCEAAYSASKAGLAGLTKALAKELAPSGVTVNAVSPGCIDTDMMRHYGNEEMKDILSDIPLGRMGDAAEVANTVLFLARNSYITGQIIRINGGQII